MSLFKGAMFFITCLVIGTVLWGVNVVNVDNAIPNVLSGLTAVFPNTSMGDFNGTWWAQFFLTLIRYAPIFIAGVVGLVGFVLEISIFRTDDQRVW